MGNIMPVTHTLDGPAQRYACHQYQKNKHEVLEVIVQNQKANRNHINPLKVMLGMRLRVNISAHQF
jgi:cell division ATPase FtsA